ncbi:MAG: ABC transporter permease, partial [Microbacteriaceae bacterium]|nr:ABC transporter permease [Burkholderiaceae bacterium]
MWRHLLRLSLAEWRHHPWRHGVALLAVALGVALASSVQMINESALAEFSQAVRSVNGQPDAVLASVGREGFTDDLYALLALDESVALASPVLEIDSLGQRDGGNRGSDAERSDSAGPHGPRVALRILGVDSLKVAGIAPGLLPRPAASATTTAAGRSRFFDPDAAYLNAAALAALGLQVGDKVALQAAGGWQTLRVAGSVAAGGAALVVVDIATAQARFGRAGRLSRVDLRLAPGLDPVAWQRGLTARLPPGVRWGAADDAVQRVSNLSRAYRVNLGVLAMVALLVGGFLVYSVVSLSVAQRTPSLALLGVLGLAARDRRALVLGESAVVGLVGSSVGLAAGAGLAALALRLLGGDLGGGYFSGAAPPL